MTYQVSGTPLRLFSAILKRGVCVETEARHSLAYSVYGMGPLHLLTSCVESDLLGTIQEKIINPQNEPHINPKVQQFVHQQVGLDGVKRTAKINRH